ncbi:MAG: PilZ domain-containing protein [Erythrobacter sp.]|jgi:hypothetical protein|nr:PilZ domain-containing protein [Erythrobacter sp.]
MTTAIPPSHANRTRHVIPRDRRYKVNLWVTVHQHEITPISARMSNFSRRGCRIACMIPLNADDQLVIKTEDGERLEAKIVWANARAYGCEFETPLADREIITLARL